MNMNMNMININIKIDMGMSKGTHMDPNMVIIRAGVDAGAGGGVKC
jgi:hypothetical protein